jgi:hypothetical protein
VVDAPRTQALPPLAIHERSNVDRSKRSEREPGQLRVEEVDAKADGIRSVGGQMRGVVLAPPTEEIADRASPVVRCKWLEAIELAPRSKLQLLGERLRGPLRVGNGAALSPPPGGVLPPGEPVAPLVADCRGQEVQGRTTGLLRPQCSGASPRLLPRGAGACPAPPPHCRRRWATGSVVPLAGERAPQHWTSMERGIEASGLGVGL